MAQKVSGTWGGEDITLNNAASEATLTKLLATTKEMARLRNVDMSSLEAKLKNLGNEADETSDALDDLEDSSYGAAGALSKFGGALSMLVSGVNSLGHFAANVTALGASMATTQYQFRDLSEALEDSSLNILGLGTLLNTLVKLVYVNLDGFEQLSRSGIVLGDRFDNLNADSAKFGVSLSTFADILGANTEGLAMLGGASSGARKFIDSLGGATGATAMELRTLGLSYEEMLQTQIDFFVLERRRFLADNANTTLLAQESKAYARSLKALSELTGEQTDNIRQEVEKTRLTGAFETFLQGIEDPEVRERIRMTKVYLDQTEGEAAGLAFIAKKVGAPLPEIARFRSAVFPRFIEIIEQSSNLANTSNLKDEEYVKQLDKRNRDISQSFAGEYQTMAEFATTMQIFSANGSEFLTEYNAFNRKAVDAGAILQSVNGTVGESILGLDESLRKFREFMAELTVKFFGNEKVIKGMQTFADLVASFVETLPATVEFYNPFDDKGRQRIINRFLEIFDLLQIAILKSINSTWIGGAFVDNSKLAELEAQYSSNMAEGGRGEGEAKRIQGIIDSLQGNPAAESGAAYMQGYNLAQKNLQGVLTDGGLLEGTTISSYAGSSRPTGYTVDELKTLESKLDAMADENQITGSLKAIILAAIKESMGESKAFESEVGDGVTYSQSTVGKIREVDLAKLLEIMIAEQKRLRAAVEDN